MPIPTVDEDFGPLSLRVIDAIAEATGSDPLEMPPLYHTVDLTALEDLFRGGQSVSVEFEYEGCAVSVRSDGSVTVDGVRDRGN